MLTKKKRNNKSRPYTLTSKPSPPHLSSYTTSTNPIPLAMHNASHLSVTFTQFLMSSDFFQVRSIRFVSYLYPYIRNHLAPHPYQPGRHFKPQTLNTILCGKIGFAVPGQAGEGKIRWLVKISLVCSTP